MTRTDDSQETLPSVADFFRGKNVFVTGASGFMGRTLIEKLLREAPDIGTVFVLLRAKKGKQPQERVRAMTDVKLFQRLRKEQPLALDKVRAVAGDAQEAALGLSARDAALLRAHVHVAFHVAASVRFDDPLKKAVLLNVRGTREMCQLALGMDKLQALIHVSTAYCNSDKLSNEECLHPSPGDWKLFVEAAETLDEHVLRCLTLKLQGGHPNTYVFTKALAEQVVNDYRNVLPAAIIRPSVVTSSLQEPFCGWIDNLNGPFGISLGVGLGIKHSFYIRGADLDAIPVDLCINGTILLAMERARTSANRDLKIVNASKYNAVSYKLEELYGYRRLVEYDHPVPMIYKPFLFYVRSYFLEILLYYMIDLPIALFYEILSCLSNTTLSMLKVQRKIYLGTKMVMPFNTKTYHFPNEKFLELEKCVNPVDKGKFTLSVESTMRVPHFLAGAMQLKRMFVKEAKHPKRLGILLEVIHYTIVAFFLYVAWITELPSLIPKLVSKILGFYFYF